VIKPVAEHSIIWGVVVGGWLNLVQPWLTAIATVLAIAWTLRQLWLSWKKKSSKRNSE
jgi:ABC-type Mn2+/Zn2+ transport system permease subunit